MTHSVIYAGDNSHVAKVNDLRDLNGNIQTDANVQLVTILDSRTQTPVIGIAFPIALAHVTDGNYRAVLPLGGTFVVGRTYDAEFEATSTEGFRAEWIERLICKRRIA